MKLTDRKELLVRLGTYMMAESDAWEAAKRKAYLDNNWFTTEFINLAVQNIVQQFLQQAQLDELSRKYDVPAERLSPKKVGIVMAGNIPLVGFHDFLCVFISGHIALIKPSSKDEALITHLINKLVEWQPGVAESVAILPRLKGCDAYIATGSNNSSRYFEQYFGAYPHIIRRNRTSVAILSGNETTEALEAMADDIHQYFGLGCRNVTKLYVPRGYDFVPLLNALRKYDYLIYHNKYKNNYDYQLAAHILNNRYYMTNGSILLVEDAALFAPIAQVHYQFYDSLAVVDELQKSKEVQCVVGGGGLPFGSAQTPGVCSYADGVDTMDFLGGL